MQGSNDIAQSIYFREYTLTMLSRLAAEYKQTETAEEFTKKMNISFPQEMEIEE